MAIQHDIIENLIRFDQMAREDGKKYPLKRFLFNRLEYLLTQTRQMAGISGLRGTGKTVLLRQLSIELDHAFPDFDTLSIFFFQVVDKQWYVKFAPPFWVAQASESPTFAYVRTQKEESLGYYQYRRCRKAQWYLPGDYYHRHQ